MDVTFLFYSHHDYSDIWDILRDTSKSVPSNCKRIVAINANSPTQPTGFDGIITYDDSLNYSDKVLSILNQIDTTYVAFIHDNDLIMSFSEKDFVELIELIKLNKIDRCMFGVIGKNNGSIHHPNFNLVNTNNTETKHFLIPYDVGPSIWRVQAFKAALGSVPNTSYRWIEDSGIQSYCKINLNMYGFSTDDSKRAYYVIGRPFTEMFQFLHIFIRGKVFEPHVYMDQEANFIRLRDAYPALNKREIQYDSHPIDLKLRLV